MINKVRNGEKTDELPVWLTKHSGKGYLETTDELVEREIAFQEAYDWCFSRIAPSASVFTIDWGCEYTGLNWLGTPTLSKYAVTSMEDWKKIRVLSPDEGRYGIVAEAVRKLSNYVRESKPNMITVFSPLSMAMKIAPEGLVLQTIVENPNLMNEVLSNIAETNVNFIKYCAELGGDSLYFPTWTANTALLTDEQFKIYELDYSNKVLDGRYALNR